MKIDRRAVDRWIELKNKQCREKYGDDYKFAYASLSGILSAKVADLAVGGVCREVAIEGIQRDLEDALLGI